MSLPTILLILAAISAGAMTIAVIIAFRSHREAQSAIFPIVREEEGLRAQRARLSIFVWVAITALFLGGWLATLRLTSPSDSDTNAAEATSNPPTELAASEPEPELAAPSAEPSFTPVSITADLEQLASVPTPTETPVSLPTLPPEATQAPPATPTPLPTATFTPLPATATPSSTPVPPTTPPTDTPSPIPPTYTATPDLVALQAPTGRTPAPPGVRMGPIKFAEDVTPDLAAVNVSDRFLDGIPAVYAIYPFSGMPKGVDFKAIWFQNGLEVERDEEEWPWGESDKGFRFLVPRGEGLYKLELHVNDTIVATGLFEVRK